MPKTYWCCQTILEFIERVCVWWGSFPSGCNGLERGDERLNLSADLLFVIWLYRNTVYTQLQFACVSLHIAGDHFYEIW